MLISIHGLDKNAHASFHRMVCLWIIYIYIYLYIVYSNLCACAKVVLWSTLLNQHVLPLWCLWQQADVIYIALYISICNIFINIIENTMPIALRLSLDRYHLSTSSKLFFMLIIVRWFKCAGGNLPYTTGDSATVIVNRTAWFITGKKLRSLVDARVNFERHVGGYFQSF